MTFNDRMSELKAKDVEEAKVEAMNYVWMTLREAVDVLRGETALAFVQKRKKGLRNAKSTRP